MKPNLQEQIDEAFENYLDAIERCNDEDERYLCREFMRLKRLERGVEEKR